jgi:dihydroorotase
VDRSIDIAIAGEFIADIHPQLNSTEAKQVIDVNGLIVVSGLIDFHSHAFLGASDLGIETDPTCLSTGVTTLVDGGSSGAATFLGFKDLLIDRAEVRLFAFLHISSIGMADVTVGVSSYLNLHNPEYAAKVASQYPDLIVGIKVGVQKEQVGDNGIKPLRLAKKAASLAGGLPVMVHVTNPVVPLNQILELLEPGDIVTHFLHGRGMGILDEKGKISESVKEARKRGIIFDVGHGRKHFNFNVAQVAIGEGFLPDTISSDLIRAGKAGTAKDLPNVLSKFLNLGMDLRSVLSCVTKNPARLLRKEGMIGTLRKGTVADIAIFLLESGDFTFEDVDGNTLRGQCRLVPKYTLRRGKLTYPPLTSVT